MAFALHVPIIIPCLLEAVVTYSKVSLREHEAVEETKFGFVNSYWKYLILFLVLDYIFLQARFKISCCLLKSRGPNAVNLDITNFNIG